MKIFTLVLLLKTQLTWLVGKPTKARFQNSKDFRELFQQKSDFYKNSSSQKTWLFSNDVVGYIDNFQEF